MLVIAIVVFRYEHILYGRSDQIALALCFDVNGITRRVMNPVMGNNIFPAVIDAYPSAVTVKFTYVMHMIIGYDIPGADMLGCLGQAFDADSVVADILYFVALNPV